MAKWSRAASGVIAFLLLYVLSGLPMFAGSLVGYRRWDTLPGTLLWALLIPVFFAGCHYLARWVGINDLGLRFRPGWSRNLLLGFGLGCAEVGLVLLLGLVTGSFQVTAFNIDRLAFFTLSISLLEFLYVALSEELVFRSFLAKLLPPSLSRTWVAAITALLFVVPHLGRFGMSPVLAGSLFLAGLIYILLFLMTGSLWMSVGMHWAFNVFNLLLVEQQAVLVKTWSPESPWNAWLYLLVRIAILLALPLLLRRLAPRDAQRSPAP